jgi:four helix bundle protein
MLLDRRGNRNEIERLFAHQIAPAFDNLVVSLQVHDVALELIGSLKPIVSIIARHDRSLAEQIKRSGSGIALALGEGAYSRKGNQPARFQEALASAGETRTALRVALAWGYMSEAQTENAFVLLDRVIGMCWRLTHPKR